MEMKQHPLSDERSKRAKPHVLYVVRFSDRRIKFGVSADVERRMRYYRQEARRNNVDGLVWWACAPFRGKDEALCAERVMKAAYRDCSQKYQREWLLGTAEFNAVLGTAETLRGLLGHESDEAKKDLPYLASMGQFQGLSA